MKKFWSGSLIAAAFGTAMVAVNPAPASAQLARPQVATDLTGGKSLVTEVQYRRGWRGGYRYGRYPYRGYRYNRFGIGSILESLFFGRNYWISDPWQYRLPLAPPGYQWVRYYNDVLLVDVYTGEVLDVIYNFFW